MKKLRDPLNSMATEIFKVFRMGLEGRGAAEYPLTSACENSSQDLLKRLAVEPLTAALVKF